MAARVVVGAVVAMEVETEGVATEVESEEEERAEEREVVMAEEMTVENEGVDVGGEADMVGRRLRVDGCSVVRAIGADRGEV